MTRTLKLSSFMLAVVTVTMVTTPGAAVAQDPNARYSFQESALPLLKQYCADCHMKDNAEAGITFDRYENQSAAVKDGRTWIRVRDALQGRVMPPADEPQPALEE